MYSKLAAIAESDQEIVGHSPAFQYVLNQVRIIAKSDSVTLIQGETGTGKEVIARAIHDQSLRNRGPFVKFKCDEIPGPWRESEFFAHERGAFTGAFAQTKGACCKNRSLSAWAAARPFGSRAGGGRHESGSLADGRKEAISRGPVLQVECH